MLNVKCSNVNGGQIMPTCLKCLRIPVMFVLCIMYTAVLYLDLTQFRLSDDVCEFTCRYLITNPILL